MSTETQGTQNAAPVGVDLVIPDRVWLNGAMTSYDRAPVPALCHTLHYGTGVFEGIRFYWNGTTQVIFRLQDHLERLKFSASVMHMVIPFNLDELAEGTIEAVRASGLQEGYIRPFCFYGAGLGIAGKQLPVNTCIAVLPWPQKGTQGIRLAVPSVCRLHPYTCNPSAKVSGTYFNSYLASREVQAEGYDDALMLDTDGFVSEAAAANVFWTKREVVSALTSPSMLPGITRATVLTLADDLGLVTAEVRVNPDTLRGADEIFLTGTAYEVRRVSEIRYYFHASGPAAVTERIATMYSEVVHGRDKQYSRWLTEC